MARYPLRGRVRDGNGKVISGATVSIYLADTATAITAYPTKTGGANNFGIATTDANGEWIVYCDDANYPQKTLFDAEVKKDGCVTQTYEDINFGG
jgi:hypothetical protein